MKKLYYYVPPCPACGSKKTGRYVREHRFGDEYIVEESTRNGEIICLVPEIGINNGFCTECNHEFPFVEEARFFTEEQIIQEKTDRGLKKTYAEHQKNKSKEKKPMLRRLITGIFGI